MIAASEADLIARCAMHIVVRYLVISFLANAALAQPCFAQSSDNLRIEKLVIESKSLPSDAEEKTRYTH